MEKKRFCLTQGADKQERNNLTSNSSYYICPRLGYHVYCAMNCTTFITFIFMLPGHWIKLWLPQKISCAIRKVLFIYFENVFSSSIVAIHFLGNKQADLTFYWPFTHSTFHSLKFLCTHKRCSRITVFLLVVIKRRSSIKQLIEADLSILQAVMYPRLLHSSPLTSFVFLFK